MAPIVLKEFLLQCSIDSFLKCFWLDISWYERFLSEKLEDISVNVGDWALSSSRSLTSFTRNVKSYHPSKISFPGLPSHAESHKTQTYEMSENGNFLTLSIKETNSFRGIPYADYFTVNTEWVVVSSNKEGGEKECAVKILLDFSFLKSTWLQGTIESNTRAELLTVYELWLGSAEEYLLSWNAMDTINLNIGSNINNGTNNLRNDVLHSLSDKNNNDYIDDYINGSIDEGLLTSRSSVTPCDTHESRINERTIGDRNADRTPDRKIDRTGDRSSRNNTDIESGTGGIGVTVDPVVTTTRKSQRNSFSGLPPSSISNSPSKSDRDKYDKSQSRDTDDSRSLTSNYCSDDELQFYDCEESNEYDYERNDMNDRSNGRNSNGNRHYRNNDETNDINGTRDRDRDALHRTPNSSSMYSPYNSSNPSSSSRRRVPTPEKLRLQYSQSEASDVSSVKDLAVQVVETLFVLAEFSFWKVHRVYTHDFRVLFDVEPREVFVRICNSFLPGWHSSVLQSPDLYGPMVAVLMMPQILLLSMGVTRHGCNQSALLGNAVVVSFCLWIGLSSLYRILALVIAPTIEMRHCLSITGYSFFAWNLALLLSYPLEEIVSLQDFTGLPVFLPLALFGLPSSIAQGCMFWEHTPASSLTLQPQAFPSSLQMCASQHIRCLQKVAWAIPKVLAFVVVTGTHYQFLWYVARVFLPGKKELCQLSALVQPSQYADIITQKELRKYALMLLSGKKHG